MNTTTWVPVVYQADEYAWAVFFLRIGHGSRCLDGPGMNHRAGADR
ncbi:MAG: hypothetical protein U0575_03210 [Phycisphaerales bacterium]